MKRYPVHTSRSAVPGFSSSRDTPGKQKHNVDWHENRKGSDVAWSATLCVTAYAKTASAIICSLTSGKGFIHHSFIHSLISLFIYVFLNDIIEGKVVNIIEVQYGKGRN